MDASIGAGAGAAEVRLQFRGTVGAMAPLVWKGLLLTVLTLGVYRFWYVTSVRRFLWGATEIDGDGVEYSGRGIELFIGFLIALAVVVPIYAAFALLGLLLGGPDAQAAQALPPLVIAVLAQYALFRARRYRLTRTIWHGVRLHQTGSGWAYAGRSIGWGVVALATLGLAYPAMRASLERYKMENTWYGDQKASFDATGWQLFRSGILLWALAVVLVVGPMAVAGAAWTFAAPAQNATPWAFFGPAIGVGVLSSSALAVILPVYQAIEYRWWANGCRFGETRIGADIGLFAFLRIYLVFALVLILTVALLGAIGFAAVYALRPAPGGEPGAGLFLFGAVFYFAFGLVVASLWQLFGARAIWKKSVESMVIVNLGSLVAAQSSAPPANAFGEGVADAIDFGGF